MKDKDAWYCTRCKYKEDLEGNVLSAGNLKEVPRDGKPQEVEWPDGVVVRGIEPKIRRRYGCVPFFSEDTGEIEKIGYPLGPDRMKVRSLPKAFYFIGHGETHLFGINQPKSNTLMIVGGEEDAMAACQMLSSLPNPPTVVSLSEGENSFRCLIKCLDYIKSFPRVILCLDMDEVGQAGNIKIANLLNGNALIMRMQYKDANDCLLNGTQEEFQKDYKESKLYRPSGIVTIDDVWEKALAKPEWGVPFPWPTLTAATYGMREGDGYYVGAGVKIGKSEMLNELATHLIRLGKKPFLIKGEEIVHLTARKLAGKLVHKIFHRPDIPVSEDDVKDALSQLRDNVLLYNRDNSLQWDDVKASIRHAVIVEGSKFIFIDPVTCLTDGLDSSEANRFLQQFSRELDQMAKDLGFTYFVFSHLNPPKTGPDHEHGGQVLSSQFTGSRAMMRTTTYMIGIERNKDPELEEIERNTSHFVLLEDRNNGNTCKFPVVYNNATGDYLELDREF